jgi:anti-sigma factor RsiW
MRDHLSEEQLLDAVGDGADGAVERHLTECLACAARAAAVREGLQLAQAAEVPEPSPFYWEALQREIGHRIREERSRFWRFRLVPALLAAAAAVAIVALGPLRAALAPHAAPASAGPLPAWSALPPAEDDGALSLVQQVALEHGLSPASECRGSAECLVDLSDEESHAVADALKAELARSPL